METLNRTVKSLVTMDLSKLVETLNNARDFILTAENFEDFEVWPAMLISDQEDCELDIRPAYSWLEALISEQMLAKFVEKANPTINDFDELRNRIFQREVMEARLYHQLVAMDKGTVWSWTKLDKRG